MQIEKPLQRHGGRLEKNETYCGSCFGAESVDYFISLPIEIHVRYICEVPNWVRRKMSVDFF